jgi:hypothetical protein
VSLYPPQITEGRVVIDTGDSRTILRCSLPAAPVAHTHKHRDHYGNEVDVYLVDFPVVTDAPELSVTFTLE